MSKGSGDRFEGLQLPGSAWKALDEAKITSLKQLRAMAPQIERIPGIEPEIAQVIKDTLDRLASGRIVRVRLVFPKHPLT
ncbi:hypothetical protein AA309_27060 [Microvirga vignae]|uniref:Uncharacterized protein n=1 Tax=Microvirga vignae TaxID=1225564 RepID=A0A0H1R522_9HYPH|nr:hypothetical protein AA309_27060 [Microvirga vignae]